VGDGNEAATYSLNAHIALDGSRIFIGGVEAWVLKKIRKIDGLETRIGRWRQIKSLTCNCSAT